MKIAKLLGKVLILLIFLYGMIGFFLLPGIVKDEVSKNTESILKRKVSLEGVSVNPFSFEVTLDTLIIHSKGKERTLGGVKILEVNLDPLDFIFGDIKVSNVKLVSPFLTLHKNREGKFNFSDLLSSESNTSGPSEEKTPLPSLVVEKFSIRQGKINFIDETGSETFSQTLSPINFTLRDFSTKQNHENQLSLYIEIDDGAYVDYRGKINSVEPLRLEGELSLHSGRLYTQWKYFQDSLGFVVADGSLDAFMSYNADFSGDKAHVYINKYHVSIDKLRLQEKGSKENILKMPSFKLEGSADLGEQEIRISTFSIKDFSIKAKRDKEGMVNWLNYFPASHDTEESNSSEQSPWKIEIAKFDLGMKDSSFEEHYAPKAYITSFEELGIGLKNVKINSKEFRIPSFDFTLSQMSLHDMDNNEYIPFSLEELGIKGSAELKEQGVIIDNISLDGMHSKVIKDEKAVLSFLSYIPYKGQEQPKESSSMIWEVKNLSMKNSRVDFTNRYDAVDGLTKIDNIDLKINNLSSKEGSWASSTLAMNINKDAKVHVSSKIRQSPLKVHSKFVMKGFNLVKMQPYVNKKANVDINSGSIDLDFKLEHDEKQTKLLANMQMNNLKMLERREGKPFFAFSKLLVKDIDLTLKPDQIKIAKIDIYKPYARMKIDVNKTTNLQDLIIPTVNEDTNTSKKPFPIFIGKVDFKNGKGEFSDLSLPLPFKTDVHELNGQMLALGTLSNIKTTIDLDGTVDEYGLMKINGTLLSAKPKNYTDISVKFQNIDMTNLSPYTGKFIGYKLREGKMNVELSYKINDSQMLGGNRIILKKMNLGEEVESEDAISAPVSLAIALLKDSNGNIDLDVPVSGDVDAPEFGIGKVVWTAFKNLIVGVATAPFKFLGDMLGVSPDKLENIEFEEGKYTLLPPQKETLDKLAEAFISKKMLILKVAGAYDSKRDLLAIKTALFYEEALLQLEDKTTDLSKMDREELGRLLKEMYVVHFRKEKLTALKEKIEVKEISEEAKNLELRDSMKLALIADQKVSKDDLLVLARSRAQRIIGYLVEKGIDAQRLELLESAAIEVGVHENEYIPTKLELGAK